MSIGHDRDGECSGFSDFSLQATKRQTSAQPVHRCLALAFNSHHLNHFCDLRHLPGRGNAFRSDRRLGGKGARTPSPAVVSIARSSPRHRTVRPVPFAPGGPDDHTVHMRSRSLVDGNPSASVRLRYWALVDFFASRFPLPCVTRSSRPASHRCPRWGTKNIYARRPEPESPLPS